MQVEVTVQFSDLIGWSVRYLMTLRITDVLDILIMTFVGYKLLTLVQATRIANLVKGVVIFIVILGLVTLLNLNGISFILSTIVDIGILALIILFQPELRRILEEVGSRKLNVLGIFAHNETTPTMEQTVSQTVQACRDMSKSRTGALIVFEREIRLDDMARSGTILDASVTQELLKNIFFVKAPMHDGAAIIRGGRLLSAGCMLPLSRNVNISRDLGMRHRAGIGMSENSDAVVVIVSEETGSISVAIGGMLKRHLVPETLENILRNELLPQDDAEKDKRKLNIPEWLRARKDGGNEHE